MISAVLKNFVLGRCLIAIRKKNSRFWRIGTSWRLHKEPGMYLMIYRGGQKKSVFSAQIHFAFAEFQERVGWKLLASTPSTKFHVIGRWVGWNTGSTFSQAWLSSIVLREAWGLFPLLATLLSLLCMLCNFLLCEETSSCKENSLYVEQQQKTQKRKKRIIVKRTTEKLENQLEQIP